MSDLFKIFFGLILQPPTGQQSYFTTNSFSTEFDIHQKGLLALTTTRMFLFFFFERWIHNSLQVTKPYRSINYNGDTKFIYIVYLGGMFIEAEKYKDLLLLLANKIFDESNGKTVLCIITFPLISIINVLLLTWRPAFLLGAMMRYIPKLDIKSPALLHKPIVSSDVWLMGHSAGGLAFDVGKNYFKGIISVASIRPYMQSTFGSNQKPSLILASEFDGFLPPAVFAGLLEPHARQMSPVFEASQFPPFSLDPAFTYPKATAHTSTSTDYLRYNTQASVLLMEGLNHLQYADNQLPEKTAKTHRSDLISNKSLEQAHDEIATTIATFLSIHEHTGSNAQQEQQLIDHRQRSYAYLKPFMLTWSGELDRYLVKQFQMFLIHNVQTVTKSSEPKSTIILCNKCVSPSEFMYSKAFLQANRREDELYLETSYIAVNSLEHFLNYTGKPNSIHAMLPHASSIILVKCKTMASIYEALTAVSGADLPSEKFLEELDRLTLSRVAAFNQLTLNYALSLVPQRVREDYLARGRRLEFAPDEALPSPQLWFKAKLGVEAQGGDFLTSTKASTTVRSPVLYAGRSTPGPVPPTPQRMWDFYYVKLISVGFALEWIYTYSRR